MPGPYGTIFTNRLLTNMSVGFAQKEPSFIADSAAKGIAVNQQGGIFHIIPAGEFNRSMVKKRAGGAESVWATYKLTTGTYFATPAAVHVMIDDDTRDNVAGNDNNGSTLDLDGQAVAFLSTQALIYRELSWAFTFFKDGVWTGGNVDGVASGENGTSTFRQWNDPSSTPIENVRAWGTALQLKGVPRPNVLALSRPVWDALLDHPDMVGRIDRGQTAGAAMVNRANVAALFELDDVLVLESVQNTALEGAADVTSFVAGKHALLFYRPQTPGLMTPSAMYTFNWVGPRRENARQFGWSIDKWYMRERRSDRVEMNMAFAHVLTAPDAGFFFENAVS